MGAGIGTDAIDTSLVRRLIAAQFPRWADLPVARVESAGTANAMFRLGEDMAVRLPRIEGAAGDVEKEHRWLPRLAPSLPVAVPVPLVKSVPDGDFPWPWAVYRWLDGETPVDGRIADPSQVAKDLAEFVSALRRIDPEGGPASYRSESLAARDTTTRAAIGELREVVDADAAAAVWEAALNAPAWPGPPVWIHADLQPGNVLITDGQLSAVIDFGCLGLGDPAVDLIAAWYVLPAQARAVFRSALERDDAAWQRGRGWALSIALDELRYYRETNPVMATIARRVIHAVLTDADRSQGG
ncbi:aminoglycoside phosphotransferase family protein [Streptomyces sp. NBC_00286]|uniref:aminoglycoside phosphotransferase family protein n=1 Tax=Streptomyces sp. NBC_00286 TaxID=2975701 RepID=UPI002E299154|nr:aminoglycoside phosphotransferase family protein [Streptomyces sp. NBC_00286]